jgi:4-hydroxyacetophenone monooxygenase
VADYEQQVRDAVAVANIPVLLMVLVHLTGELRWLEQPYQPSQRVGVSDNDDGGLPPEVQAEIRAAAATAIVAWHAGQPLAIGCPAQDLILRMLSVAMGEPVPAEFGPVLATELTTAAGLELAADARRDIGVPRAFSATIVGAGVSGLCAAVAFERAGVPYVILEARDQVGGVWHENRYPGAGVDTPSHLYAFSFAPYDWSQYFALRGELHQYLQQVATDFGILPHVRFGTRVTSAAWQAESQSWHVEADGPDGPVTTDSSILVSAVGIFNPPVLPDIPGLAGFAGPAFHSARWRKDLDLRGRRVGIIGNGASSMQVVPAVAPDVAELTVFQRSPHWIMPFEKFHQEIPDPVRWLMRELPLYRAWYRLRLGWTFNDKVHPTLQKDPDWPHPARSVSKRNDRMRVFLTEYITDQLGDREDLLQQLLPDYPPYGKRMLLDNGWYTTLRRPNVRLVSDPVTEVREHSVVTRDGREHLLDVLVFATGFDVTRFLTEFTVIGRSGRPVQYQGDDMRAYLGTVLPDLPNFFCLYGPNTQPGHGGSILSMIETQVRYMMSVLEQMFARELDSVEVRSDVCTHYNAAVDAAHERMVWTHPGMRTYYRNSKGRVVVNSPYRIVDWWYLTKTADVADFITEPARHGAPRVSRVPR